MPLAFKQFLSVHLLFRLHELCVIRALHSLLKVALPLKLAIQKSANSID